MDILLKIRDILSEPRLKEVNYDTDSLLSIHREILLEKPMMRDVFEEIYNTCWALGQQYLRQEGAKIEIGAGVSFFGEKFPQVILSDIKKADHLDVTLDALSMPFKASKVSTVFGINCFHHFSDPIRFFTELDRVLKPGGGCIFIEPYYGWLAAHFYKRVFETECFIKEQVEWKDDSLGYMRGANQALSYIVFKRDEERLKQLFPAYEIVHMSPLRNWPRYLISGGLNFKQVLPNMAKPILELVEQLLKPFAWFLALHHVIVIRKRCQD